MRVSVRDYEALDDGPSCNFFGNKKPKCPHCGTDFDITDNEAWHLYDDDESHIVECDHCRKDFKVVSVAKWSFDTDEKIEED